MSVYVLLMSNGSNLCYVCLFLLVGQTSLFCVLQLAMEPTPSVRAARCVPRITGV